MKPPRAELTSRQKAAQDPTELQALWREQFVLQGQLAAVRGWNNSFKDLILQAQRSCHPHLEVYATRKFTEVQKEIDKLMWDMLELERIVKDSHKKLRDDKKKHQVGSERHAKQDN